MKTLSSHQYFSIVWYFLSIFYIWPILTCGGECPWWRTLSLIHSWMYVWVRPLLSGIKVCIESLLRVDLQRVQSYDLRPRLVCTKIISSTVIQRHTIKFVVGWGCPSVNIFNKRFDYNKFKIEAKFWNIFECCSFYFSSHGCYLMTSNHLIRKALSPLFAFFISERYASLLQYTVMCMVGGLVISL